MGLSEKGFGRMGFALTLGVVVQLTDLLRLFCHFSLRFRNRPFQKEVEIVESFLVVSWFLLLISDARHAILKVLKNCLSDESVKKRHGTCAAWCRENTVRAGPALSSAF